MVLTCEKARHPGSRPAKFEGLMDGKVALFLVLSSGLVEMYMMLKVCLDGTLIDDEGRLVTVRRDEHRERYG